MGQRITKYRICKAPAIRITKAPPTGQLQASYNKMSGYSTSFTTNVEKRILLDEYGNDTLKHNFAVRVRRTTVDRSKDDVEYKSVDVYDEATWSVAAGVIHKLPIQIPVGVRASEFCIRASENFNGSVNAINAVAISSIPVYIEGLENGWTDLQEWNPATWGRTRNPADLLHYVLTNSHALHDPFPVDRLDADSFIKFWKYCDENDFKFDLVCDSERNSWELWSAIASAGRGTLTVDRDGRFAVVIDGYGVKRTVKNGVVSYTQVTPTQMFTPLNSWDFTIDRQFTKVPHALRVTYHKDPEADLNITDRKALIKKQKNNPENLIVYADGHVEVSTVFESDAYEQREDFIYAQGYGPEDKYDDSGNLIKKAATDIVDWSFTGKTRFEDLWKMGRYYLAAMRLRPYSVTLRTDWEWLMCHRGDVVAVAHDVLMNTFGVARITALVYIGSLGNIYYRVSDNAEDLPNGAVWVEGSSLEQGDRFKITATNEVFNLKAVQIDDTVIFSEASNYAITIRSGTGEVAVYSLDKNYHTLNSASDVLYLTSTITGKRKVRPYVGAMISVSTSEVEIDRFLVATITPGDGNTAELSLMPYNIEGILESIYSEEIPEPDIKILNNSIGDVKTLPKITKLNIISDESMLYVKREVTRSGVSFEVVPRMKVSVVKPNGVSPSLSNVQIQVKIVNTKDKLERTAFIPYEGDDNECVFSDVKDGVQYKVSARLVCDEGVTSEWKDVTHTIIGRTAPPAEPTGLYLQNKTLVITLKEAPYDLTGFKIYAGNNADTKFENATYIGTATANFTRDAFETVGQKVEASATYDLSTKLGEAEQAIIYVKSVDQINILSENAVSILYKKGENDGTDTDVDVATDIL